MDLFVCPMDRPGLGSCIVCTAAGSDADGEYVGDVDWLYADPATNWFFQRVG